MEQKIKELYDAKCRPNACNCFLHSYHVPTTLRPGLLCDGVILGDFSLLKPFVEHVESVHECITTLDIETLRAYAKQFIHPELTFEGANFQN